MEIGLIDRLRKFAKLPPLLAAKEGNLLFCWNATRIQDGGRSLLVASMLGIGERMMRDTDMTIQDKSAGRDGRVA